MLKPEESTKPVESNKPVPLAQAPTEVQLAVDLIMLLEQQQLPPATVLAALAIVHKDFQRQLVLTSTTNKAEK
ncbi:DUF2496 domain-containing protein [Rheinheimera sp. 4Y26]|uniref:DUF2496 domain-containing protein n=1 Tax=Rheinheimera sp. 4Y26 TaxID=2977811 RepID=UPI0021B0CB31|nr:DUF2496 domain-containing protein [Rheinheimera sp. 4Y26]MCT6700114.1 DUF2496 domain-containing protein [Rheinheimera sp. 4Y26]